MEDNDDQRRALAEHLTRRRAAILEAWRNAIKRDPALTSGEPLPRMQLFDHIPAMLAGFECALRDAPAAAVAAAQASTEPAPADVGVAVDDAGHRSAAAHGLQRWRQGYDLREVTRELGKLNECVVAELDAFTVANPGISHAVVAAARRVWAALCSTGIEESVGQYFQRQQQEAAGQVRELERALSEIRELERQRANLWQQAAHDLRGNLGVVANATVGLTYGGLREATRDSFVQILMRNVSTLHHLLDDVTSLARLQAGREQRQIEPLDLSSLIEQLCDGVRPLAQQRHLFLRCEGPAGFSADGDAVKIRRIAQNLILNAVKFTRQGGITVTWGDSSTDDGKRWELCIADTGPGLPSDSHLPLACVGESIGEAKSVGEFVGASVGEVVGGPVAASPAVPEGRTAVAGGAGDGAGEGIGLSIVKRLCELLDATVEMHSAAHVGTTFRILFPRRYAI
jgi:signal transduction histidine kinase